MMLISGTMPPSGVNESCMPLTAPQLASVVDRGKERRGRNSEAHFLAFHIAAGLHGAHVLVDSVQQRIAASFRRSRRTVTPARNKIAIAAQTAQPCRCEPVIRPSV